MKIYYNKERDIYIILSIMFLIGWIVFLLYNECPIYWLPVMCAIPLIIIFLEFLWKKQLYIKSYDGFVEFTVRNIEKYNEKIIKHRIKIKNILTVTLNNNLLTIITTDSKYEIVNFHLKKEKIEKIFDKII